ncbi:uncharacterized protein M6B38_405145 [Iris pallida]|uniref:Uncharacterized protein n=1 Tax=Iris pallida TaxID=29817 RepID=A0AAX6FS63_IRIPA|nr:uncharacterized protein M6B38_405145 [Iris pallida]
MPRRVFKSSQRIQPADRLEFHFKGSPAHVRRGGTSFDMGPWGLW